MRKSLKRILVSAVSALMAFTVLLGCKTPETSSGEKPKYDPGLLYEGYDPSLRIEDTRGLSAQEYSIFNAVGKGDFENHEFGASDGLKTDKDRYVGMFYFMQQGQHDDHLPGANDAYPWQGPYDVSKILAQYGREKGFNGDYAHSPANKAHWWGESVFGYYHAADPYVMRKNIEMLTFAGVDFLFLDCTNGFVYRDVTDALFPVIKEYRDAGWPAPQIVFYFNNSDRNLLRSTYVNYYSDPKYDTIWFRPDGKKPMTVINKTTLDEMKASTSATEIKMCEYFDFRATVWPNQRASQPAANRPVFIDPDAETNGFPWLDFNHPQKIFKQTSGEGNGIVNVSGSQHPTDAMSVPGSWGRGWTHTDSYTWDWPRPNPIGKGANNSERYCENLNLQQQWETVFANDDKIQIVSVTGWNEWAMGKYHNGSLGYYTVDGYNDEFSRDLMPTRTGNMKDNAYLLNTALTRKWKNTAPKHYVYPALSPADINDPVWSDASKYMDFKGKSMKRNFKRTDGMEMLTDDTPRNIITEVSVARDEQNLYFAIKCAADITQKDDNDKAWMNLHINTKNAFNKDHLGYQFTVNKNVSNGKTEILMPVSNGGKTYAKAGEGDVSVSGNAMFITVPLEILGLNARNYEIEFKVTDNTAQNDVLDFYASGDSAPCGRLNWSFGY